MSAQLNSLSMLHFCVQKQEIKCQSSIEIIRLITDQFFELITLVSTTLALPTMSLQYPKLRLDKNVCISPVSVGKNKCIA